MKQIYLRRLIYGASIILFSVAILLFSQKRQQISSPLEFTKISDQEVAVHTQEYQLQLTQEGLKMSSGEDSHWQMRWDIPCTEAVPQIVPSSTGAAQQHIEYLNLYERTDLIVYDKGNGQAAYDLILSPGADPGLICMELLGTKQPKLSPDGELILPTSEGAIRHSAPYAYQHINGEKVAVNSSFQLEGNCLSFHVGNYDSNETLIIDPEIYYIFQPKASDDSGAAKDLLATSPAYESDESNADISGTGSLTINRPAGTMEDDFLLAGIVIGGNDGITPPSGWTSIGQANIGVNRYAYYWKLATGSEPGSYTFTIAGTPLSYGAILRYSGVNPSNPINASSSNSGNSMLATHPSVNVTTENTTIIRISAFSSITANTPAGHDTRIGAGVGDGGTGTGFATIIADVAQMSTGATGTASHEVYEDNTGTTPTDWATFTLALESIPDTPPGDADYTIETLDGQTTNTCTGLFTDSGDTNGDYGDGETYSTTFCSDSDNQISFTFEHFNVASGDALEIFDGENTGATSLGSFSGVGESNSPGVVTSSGSCLTFEFSSDGSGTAPGWEASISCTGTPDVSASAGSWDGYTGGSCGNSTTIAGTVYEDINNDGTEDSRDAPIFGVEVSLYDDDGQVGSSTTTDANGEYSFGSLSDQVYRVEFSIPADLTEGPYGSGSGTAVQFVKPGTCADLGLVDVAHYCDNNNPFFVIPCYVNGDPQDDSNNEQVGIVGFEYTDSGNSPAATSQNYVTAGAVGTIYGAAFDAETENLYMAAFLKRHAGLGPNGIGAIYRHTDGDPNTSAPLFYDFGSAAGMVADNATRFPGSGDEFGEEGPCGTCDNIDPSTFGQVGKAGFGDIEINPENTHLYVTNLFDRKVYMISLDNPAANSATPLPAMPWLDNSVCSNGIARPWALEFRRGKLYVGVVCDASLGSCTPGSPCSDLTAEVYSFDGTTWTNELSQSLDYYRQAYVTGSNYFVPWIDNWATMAPYVSGITDASFAQPIVMDIEFDDDHAMILGIGDRTSMQLGYQAPPPPGPSGSTAERNLVFGDILRAAYDNSTGNYTMENNGVVGGLTTTNPNGSSGIGGRSFYWGDYWTGIGANRFQGAIGPLATLPGSGQVMTALADAIDYYSNGVVWMHSTNGANARRLEVYQGSPNGLEPNFAKSAGVGDIELFCDRPGIEIGNIAWWDDNLNGRQDPSEPGIEGVTIELWIDPNGSAQNNQALDGSAVKVAETTTDEFGRYIFSYDGNPNSPETETWLVGDRVLPETYYQVRIPDWINDTGLTTLRDALGYSSHLLSPTQNQGPSGGERDNNAYDNPGNAASAVQTGLSGDNDHSHDFAFGGVGGCEAPTVVPGSNTPCDGEDLALTATVSGGQAPYSYSWSGPNGFSSTDQNPTISSVDASLAAGTYNLTVTDALDCTEEVSIVVAINSLALSASSTDATCGNTDGSIDLTITGQAPYTIDWSDDALDGTEDPTGLGAGLYTVTVTDADGCSATTSASVNSGNAPTLAEVHVDETCGDGNGSITVSITDGASASISWSGNAPTPTNTPTSTVITGLSAGTYSVTVTNTVAMLSCSAFLSVTIENSEGPSLSFTQVNESCGNANGSIDLSVSGGLPPYSYDWSDDGLDGTEDPAGLANGTYDVTVTDANLCTVVEQIMISNAAAPTLSASTIDETCGNSNGSIDLTVMGGTMPFTYAWSNGLTTEDINALGAGSYTVTVTDANGCTVQTTETINAIDGPSLAVSVTNASDCSSTDGAVDLTISGGTATFSYNWSNGSTSEDLAAVEAGTYTVTVTDGNSCMATITAIVTNDTDPVLSVVVTDPMGCGETGSVDLTVSGGIAPYTFDWSNDGLGEIDDEEDISGLSSGIYTVVVIGADGCSAQANVSIREIREPVLTPSLVAPSCGMSDGEISVSISDPDGVEFGGDTYTFEWSDIGTGTAMRTGLAAGNYSLTVSNEIGCSTVRTFSLDNTAAPSLSPSITSPTCGGNNGSITISVSGGTPSYSYQWSRDGSPLAESGATINNQSNGLYGVTVTDMAGCAASLALELTSSLPPSLSAMASPTSCDTDDGAIDLVISGVAPFQVNWGHIAGTNNSEDLTGLGEGYYNVTVTDANGCQSSESVSIAIFGLPVVTLNDPSDRCVEDTDMTFTATPAPAMGTTGVFSSSASSGFADGNDGTATLDLSAAGPGTYTVTYTYTDENGCMSSEMVSVTIYGVDYGDLPSQYAVTLSENGGRHCVPPAPTIYMGGVPDTETDGIEDDDAGEIAGGDGADEDGLTKPNMLFRGEEATFEIEVVTGSTVYIYGFIDWNNDGAFTGPGEVENTTASGSGPVNLTFEVPQNAAVGVNLGARFRIGSVEDEVDQATGLASDGEVEDYVVQVKDLDFGDLPDAGIADTPDYNTDYQDDGPRHGLSPTPLVFFGDGVEQDDDGQASTDADGDAEEDDVTLPTMLFRGENATFSMNVTNNSDSTAKVVAYVDWDGDGDFDEMNEMGSSTPIAAMSTDEAVSITMAVPQNAVVNSPVGARFRVSTDTSAIMASPDGFAMDGEVEDYLVSIKGVDYGDAPDPDYPTTAASDGARHGVPGTPSLFLGSTVDIEEDGQPQGTANGDDNNNDDEDGVVFEDLSGNMQMIVACETTTIVVTASAPGLLNAWLDYNGNGSWTDPGEQIFTDEALSAGQNAISFTAPCDIAASPERFLRFRFDSAGELSPTGFAMDGEVEDYTAPVKGLDFGDLPDPSYPTLYVNDPARHIVPALPGLYLGAGVDTESEGAQSAMADGDGADEDGINLVTPMVPGNQACLEVSTTVPSDITAFLHVWIDFNGDGSLLETGDQIVANESFTQAENGSPSTLCFDVPSTATFAGGMAFLRARFGPEQDLAPTGISMGGEVEDHKFLLAKVGNLVWQDNNYDGIQGDATTEPGINDIELILTWAGPDGDLSLVDDNVTYSDTTTTLNDKDGIYYFCGLIDGDYSIEVNTNRFATLTGEGTATTDNDDDTGTTFSIDLANLRTSEDGTSDMPGMVNSFPDNQDDQSFDFGYAGLDFGDLPDGFETLLGNGPVHAMNPEIFLGSCVDGEIDGAPDDEAGQGGTGGDDGNYGVISFPEGVACDGDEDGIVLLTSMIPGAEACIQVTSTMPDDQEGILNAWIDFNGNGSFDEGEQIVFTKYNGGDISPTTEGPIPMGAAQTTELCYLVPEDATFEGLETHLRFRLSPEGGLDSEGVNEDGSYPLGEVEDYYQPLAKVGNYAWLDVDEDGIQDANEPPLAGVNVRLYRCDDDIKGVQEGIELTTDENGFYEFNGLLPGEYCLAFEADEIYDPFTGIPYTISPSNTGSDGEVDSNPREDGCTDSVILDPLEDDPSVDAGIIVDACYPPFSLATADCHEHGATISWKSINGDEDEGLNDHCWKLAIAGAGPQHAVFGELGILLDLLGLGLEASIVEITVCEGDPGLTIMETDDPQVGMMVYELSNDLLQAGTAYWFAVSEVCNDAPDLGNNSPWNFQRFFPITLQDEGAFPGTEVETEYAWDDYEGYFQTKDYPFEIAVSGESPTCPSYTEAYAPDGCLIVEITDGASCSGTYDIYIDEVLQSSGVVATDGPFEFCGYGIGTYSVEVEITNDCVPAERIQSADFQLEEGQDDVSPSVILSDYFAGTLIADNLENTSVVETADLGEMILPEGACSMKSYFVFTGSDNCDNTICADEAVTASVIAGVTTVDPGTQVQLYHLSGEVITDQGVLMVEDCEWVVEINWAVGRSTVEICMDDSEVIGDSDPACIRLSAEVQDNRIPQIIASPINATMPVCADEVEVIYGFRIIDACDHNIIADNVNLQGVEHEPLTANNGYFEYALRFDALGEGTVNIAYEDAQGEFYDLQVSYQVIAAAAETAPQIIAQGGSYTALPCEDGAEVIFTVHVIDDCDAITEKIGISGEGSEGLSASPMESTGTRAYVTFSGILPADEYQFTLTYPGAEDLPISIVVEQEDNAAASIDLPGNTSFTIPSCGDEVNATWSIQIQDDCDESIDLAALCIELGAGGCLSIPSAGIQVLSNENGAALIEIQRALTAADNGSVMTLSYTDGAGNYSQASQTITVNAEGGVDEIPPVIVYPTEVIHKEIDPCAPNSTTITFSVSATDNCSGWVPVLLTAPDAIEAHSITEGNAEKWTIRYAARATPYNILLAATDEAGNTTQQSMWVSITQEGASSASLSCNTNLTATVDENCQYKIGKDLALEGEFGCLTDDDIQILVDGGESDIAEGIGEHTFTVYIQGSPYCYGTITLFDNIPPSIECPISQEDFICTDLNQLLGTLEHTGSPVVTDNCTATWDWTEEVIYGEDESCDSDQIRRIFTAIDAAGHTASCEQYIVIRKPTLAEVLAPMAVMELSCDDLLGYDEHGYPIPAKTGGLPQVQTYFGLQNLDPLFCNLAATYSDSERIDVCENGYKFTRTWKVLDWCDAPNTIMFTQLIKIGDDEAPMVTAPEVDYDWDGEADLLEYSTGPFDCTAAFEVPLPEVTDNCANDFQIEIEILANGNTPILEIQDGASRYVSDIPVGCHAFLYKVTDACGNRTELEVPFTVLDKVAPTAICDDELQVSVESNGLARVFAIELDEGSWDNCSEVKVEVRRNYETDQDCVSTAEYHSPWGDYVDFSCCDIGRNVRIELRVWDDANGDGIYGNTITQLDCAGETFEHADNSNICWLEVVVEDKLDAFCVAPHAQTIACDVLPYDFDPSDIELLEDLFGEASAGDNCQGIGVVEQAPLITLDDCGTGTILRSFSTQSPDGSSLDNSCQQLITITEVHNYEIRFPADSDADCGTPDPDTITFNEIGCDLLAVSVDDEFFSASGDECYKILRTYRVINWCEYDGDGAPVIVGRDEDCDGKPGDEAVWVLRRPDGTVYFDRNNDEGDDMPVAGLKLSDCDGLTNPQGYWIDSHIDEDATRDPITGQVDNGTTNDEIRQLDSRGYWQYTQVIKVYDSVDPVITVAEFGEFEALNGSDCTGQVAITFTITDECTNEESLIIAALDASRSDVDQDGNFTQAEFMADADISDALSLEDGVYVYEADLPIGDHAILLKGSDGCGNETAKLVLFSVVDRKAPSPICISGLAVELMPTEPGTDADGDGDIDAAAMTIWANDFIASPVYDCYGQGPGTDDNGNFLVTQYSINLIDEETNSEATSLILTCDSDETTIIEIHAWDRLGNHDYCETFVLVQDLMNRCEDGDTGSIAGIIETEEEEGVQGVEVQLSGLTTEQILTQEDGVYHFDHLEVNDYSVTPHLDQDHLNGVSTFDLIVITQHILGTNLLDSPYKMIAADVNNSRSVTTLDVIEARRRILGIGEGFTNNTSWRFVAKDYAFPNPSNPWEGEFPELLSFNNLSEEQQADFIGVKIADVNGSVLPNTFSQLEERSRGEFSLEIQDVEFEAGATYRVPVSSAQLAAIAGYQATFQFDAGIMVADIEYGEMQPEHFNLELLKQGLLPISWNGKGLDEAPLFTMILQAKSKGLLSEMLSLSSRITPVEAYDQEGQLMDLKLDFGDGKVQTARFELYQNEPNPFLDRTKISFYLPEAAKVQISIYDASGRSIRRMNGQFSSGRQQVWVEQKELGVSGVLYYRVTAGQHTATRKMIIK